MRDEYTTVTAVLRQATRDAVLVDTPDGGTAWIPRSLLHAADDRRIEGMFSGEKFTFRLRAWKAVELGL